MKSHTLIDIHSQKHRMSEKLKTAESLWWHCKHGRDACIQEQRQHKLKGRPTIRLESRHDIQRLASELRVSRLDGSSVHHKRRPIQASHGNEASRHVLITAWQRNVGIIPAASTERHSAHTFTRSPDASLFTP